MPDHSFRIVYEEGKWRVYTSLPPSTAEYLIPVPKLMEGNRDGERGRNSKEDAEGS
jgi:hypothetical protein